MTSTHRPIHAWLPAAATALSLVTCYGTLILTTVLAALGISLSVHSGLWAGAIVLFAILAVLALALRTRRHQDWGPLVLALIGTAAVGWVMLVSYSLAVEITGFSLLIVAVLRDRRLTS